MATTLKQLTRYAKENYGMNTICGKSNLDNMVKWVHMLEDSETSRFLHGKELIFSTGIGHKNADWYIDFVKGLIENGASGWVLNIGPYIERVPEELKNYCDQMQFPLFTIPWKTRIVDITNDFCHRIIESEKNELSVSEAFKNLVFNAENEEKYKEVLKENEFDFNAEYCVMVIGFENNEIEEKIKYDQEIQHQMRRIFSRYSTHYTIFSYDRNLIVILQNFPQSIINNSVDQLLKFFNLINHSESFHVGICDVEFGLSALPINYQRALKVMRIASQRGDLKLNYKDTGVFKLLIEIENKDVLMRYYKTTLGKLERYDRENDTDYLNILKSYLDFNNSVEKVAKATFMHRNTINYKIKKIKEILNTDLSYEDSVQLYLAFQIREIL